MITLNLNKLNSIVKTHRMAKEIKKKKKTLDLCCLRKTHFRNKETQAESFHSNGNQKKARVARIYLTKLPLKQDCNKR